MFMVNEVLKINLNTFQFYEISGKAIFSDSRFPDSGFTVTGSD